MRTFQLESSTEWKANLIDTYEQPALVYFESPILNRSHDFALSQFIFANIL